MGILTYKKITNSGIPVTFGVISEILLNKETKTHTIVLDGYLSEKVYQTPGSIKIDTINFHLSEQDEYGDMFSESGMLEAMKENKTIYDIAYEYVQLVDKDLVDARGEN